MKSTHKIQIVYDEGSGKVTCSHRCFVEVGGHVVSHSRDVEMPEGVKDALIAFIDQNRSEVEVESEALAVAHAAALSGKVQAGTKALKVGGAMVADSLSTAKKGDK